MNSFSARSATRLSAFVLLLLVSFLAYAYQEELKTTVKGILESSWLIPSLSIYVVCCAVMYQIYVGGDTESRDFIHAHFGQYANFVFAVVAFVPACATSIVLLKGLFLQYFFQQKYFQGFDSIDMTSMVVVSSYLLYYSLFNSTKMLVVAISQADSVQISEVGNIL